METPAMAQPLAGSLELQLLSQAMTACVVGVVITDARQDDDPIVYVNPAFEALSGYSATELLGRNCRFLQGDQPDQAGVREIRRAVEQQRSTTVTLRNYRKDGSLFYNELTLSPVHDASGTLTHYVGFQNDVTAREEARQSLASVLARVTDGFVSFDRDWNFTYVNPAAAAMSHVKPDELLGQNLFTVFPSATHQPIGVALQRARETGTVQRELSFVAEVGRWLEATAYPAEDGISLLTRDVTQAHQAHAERLASEERFTKVFQASPIGIVVTRGSDGRYLDANPEFLRQSGYDREEVVGLTSRDLHFWADPGERDAVWHTLREQGEFRNREVQFRIKSGDIRDTVASIVPVTIGGEACVVTSIRDITVEKRAQQQLEVSEQRYRLIAGELQRTLDLSLDMLITVDPGARVISVSAACQRILGYAPEKLLGRSILDLIHPDDLARTRINAASVMANQPLSVFQNRYLHQDGRTVWIEWNAVSDPGDPLIYCVARDITGRRAAEEDQAFLAAIVEASHNAIVGVGLDGTIRSWNAGAERLYGHTAEGAVGQPMTLITPPELHAETEDIFRQVTQGERVEAFESVRMARDGRRVPVIATESAILDAAGAVIGVATITRDLSALQAAEATVRALDEELHQQLRHLTGLHTIDQSIASSAAPEVTLGLILDNICQQLGADAATALIVNPATHTLDYAATRGFCNTGLKGAAVEPGVGLVGWVALNRQPLHVPDVASPLVLPAWRDVLRQEGLADYYAAPLIAKDQVVGVIEVLHRQSLPISPAWLETLKTLVGQAAIAVENAHLLRTLERRNSELRLAYDETIEGWARALDLRDTETEGHSRRVTDLTVALCQQLGVLPEHLVDIRRGALLHDIGKMGIRDAVLLKPGKLTDDEWIEMKNHPEYAVDLLSPIEFLRPALDIPQFHHEKWDGSGYPRGLAGQAIPLTARAFAVVDVYDALTHHRPYRQAWTRERAIAHIQRNAGTHFDPNIVEAFIRMLGQSGEGCVKLETVWKGLQ